MERNVWTTASDSWNSCVEVKWVSACSSGGCVEVGHDGDRVLVRDSKLGEESPVIEFTPSGWRGFTTVAVEWDRATVVPISGTHLSRMNRPPAEADMCIADEALRHLHFTWKEWDTFVEGVKAGLFEVGE